ncbi:hypothetical protein [Nocardioides jejuensis]|uniref:Uncharacterized protein n=1 Tax=Nocardioides jejuensis TaxID=2502782 RepID=A0A4R1BVH4_9ACTN|nr:hypothetical protein [Nocardioides jejuensis]TCJ21990.1 hypothetical protein EPD65_13895 [Nocardioides jejuensis]
MRRLISRHPLATFILGIVLFFSIAVPAAVHADRKVDRDMDLYHAFIRLGVAQAHAVTAGGTVAEQEITHDAPGKVGHKRFHVPEGVDLRVWPDAKGFCIAGTNQYGSKTKTYCGAPLDYLPGGRFHW